MLDPFDFDGDGKVDDWERAAEAAFLYGITHDDDASYKRAQIKRKHHKIEDSIVAHFIIDVSLGLLTVLSFLAGAWVLGVIAGAVVVCCVIARKQY